VSDSAAVPVGRQISFSPPLSWLPRALREPKNAPIAIGIGWLLAFPGSLILAEIVHLLVPNAKVPDFGQVSGLYAAFLVVIVSPVVETLMMGGALLLLLRIMPPTWAVLVSAIGWGIAHSSMIPTWGLAIWWPFLIFSTLFVVWRQRSLWLAFGIPMVVHALQNLLPSLLLLSGKN
jgi:hypothetical protein